MNLRLQRAQLRLGDQTPHLRFAILLHLFHHVAGRARERLQILAQIPAPAGPASQQNVLRRARGSANRNDGFHVGVLAQRRELGDERRAAQIQLGQECIARERRFGAHELAEASRAGDLSWQAHAYNMLGQTARLQGEFRRANCLLWQALKLFREVGHPDGVSVILSSLGEVARDAGRPVKARRLFGAALRRHAAVWNKRHMAYELEGFAAAAGLEHAGQQALVYVGAAQVLREETGGPLPPVEQAILDRILAPAVAVLSARERQEALSQGRNQPLPTTIARALAELTWPEAS